MCQYNDMPHFNNFNKINYRFTHYAYFITVQLKQGYFAWSAECELSKGQGTVDGLNKMFMFIWKVVCW